MRSASAAFFIVMIFTVWADGPAAPSDHPAWAPIDPRIVFGKSPDEITKLKGEGKAQYAVNADGKWLASIDYQESWFQMADALKVEYVVLPIKDQTVIQLTVHFLDKADRKAIIEKISTFLGTPQQGKSDEGAPSQYFANWIRDAVSYDFQDYGDYKEMYVSPARFSPTERYKLSDNTLTLQ